MYTQREEQVCENLEATYGEVQKSDKEQMTACNVSSKEKRECEYLEGSYG